MTWWHTEPGHQVLHWSTVRVLSEVKFSLVWIILISKPATDLAAGLLSELRFSFVWIATDQPCWWPGDILSLVISRLAKLIARFIGPTWGPSGADRAQLGPMLAPWTLLSGHWPSLCYYVESLKCSCKNTAWRGCWLVSSVLMAQWHKSAVWKIPNLLITWWLR